MKNLRSKKKLIIIISCVIIFILLIVLIKSISSNKKVTGDRCSDADNYRLSNNTLNKAKDVINTLGNVKDIDIHTKLCTVKIIITLKDDVEIDKVKSMSKDLLKAFTEKDLKYYDFSLYVVSENKDSKTYPINVTKHNSRDSFAW